MHALDHLRARSCRRWPRRCRRPRSIRELPSTSTSTPPPAASTKTGSVVPTPSATCGRGGRTSPASAGPGIAVTRRRSCGSSGPPVEVPGRGRGGRGRRHGDSLVRQDGLHESPDELSSRPGHPRLDRVDRHPGPRRRAGQPGPVPGRRADRRRRRSPDLFEEQVEEFAPAFAGLGEDASVEAAGDGVRRGAQRHHRRGRAAADAGRAGRRQHPRAGQQGVADHRRPAGDRRAPGPARSCRSTPSTARWPSACAAAAPTRCAGWC